MPLAALLSALAFTCADLLARSPLVSPRVSRAFARARSAAEKEEEEEDDDGGGKANNNAFDDGGDKGGKVHRRQRRQQPSLAAIVEDAGIKLVGTLHVLLCLPLAIAALSEKRRNGSSLPSASDPRLLLYSSTPTSRLLVSISSGYFLWDIASILIRTHVAATERGKREGRSVGGGFLAHGMEFFFFFC